MRHRRKITAGIAAGAAGLAASLALALAPAAQAYTPDQLPTLGYAVSVLALGNNCHDWTATGYGATAHLGDDCDPGFQAALDAFVAATCPCAQPPATTTTAATTTTQATTTQATTTAPDTTAATTTDSTPPAPAGPQAPAQTSPGATASSAPAATSPEDVAALEARIAALEQEIAALTTRVDRLALAGDAAWLAYQQAIADGADPGIAALIARSTYLNAEYGLGAFA